MRPPFRLPSRHLAVAGGVVLALAGALVALLGSQAAAAPSELFVSEYVEGSSNNKALEIFNGTGAPVTLTDHYDVQIFANGSPTATATIPLTGTVPVGDAFVLARSSAVAAILAVADQTTTNFLFNGNDAVALRHDSAIVDVIGQIGVDPGVEWGSGDTSTLDRTLRRKAAIESGDTNGSDAFDPASEWDGFPLDAFDGLGAHTTSGGGGGTTGGGGGGGGGTTGTGAVDAVDDAATVEEDDASSLDVLANDVGGSLTVAGVSEPAHGIASVAADGKSVVYVPDVDYAGPDSFTYTASDGLGGTDTASVSLTVEAVNDDPEPDDDAATTPEDTAVVIDVIANDTDPEDDTLTVAAVDGGDHGTATVVQGGTQIRYEPEPDWNGSDALEYTVADASGGSETAEVLLTVTPVDDPPRARNDAAVVTEGSTVVVDVLANDSPGPADESGQSLAVSSVGQPAHGSAELVSSGPDAGRIRYTPAAGYTGPDSFTYVVSDGGSTATGSVAVTVRQAALRTLCGLTPTIFGTLGDDHLVGTPGDDVIRARRGNDVIDGNGGNDVVCGGAGADRITTAGGADRVLGGTGADTIDSGDGKDRLRGGTGADDITTRGGDDSVAAGAGADSVDAGDGRNAVDGGPGDDQLRSGSGDDRLDGGPGTDTCDADGGRNRVTRCE